MIHTEAFEAFNAEFFDETKCKEWILKKMHPEGAFCPRCHTAIEEDRRLEHFWNGERLHCLACGKYFSALTGTILSGVHLDQRRLFLMITLCGAGINDKIIAKKLNISPESCRLWRIKFKKSPLFSG
jgi:hypothetical protein